MGIHRMKMRVAFVALFAIVVMRSGVVESAWSELRGTVGRRGGTFTSSASFDVSDGSNRAGNDETLSELDLASEQTDLGDGHTDDIESKLAAKANESLQKLAMYRHKRQRDLAEAGGRDKYLLFPTGVNGLTSAETRQAAWPKEDKDAAKKLAMKAAVSKTKTANAATKSNTAVPKPTMTAAAGGTENGRRRRKKKEACKGKACWGLEPTIPADHAWSDLKWKKLDVIGLNGITPGGYDVDPKEMECWGGATYPTCNKPPYWLTHFKCWSIFEANPPAL